MDAIMLFFGLLGVYFLPSIVARAREHHQGVSIFILNLFLSWTFIGWVVALAMAALATRPREAPAA